MSPSVKELEKQILDLTNLHKADIERLLIMFTGIQDFIDKKCGEAFKGIADEQMNFNKRLKQLEALEKKFQNPISAPLCTSQAALLSETKSKVEKEPSEIISKVYSMQIEINKNNLIYYGVPESEAETGSELFSKIVPLLPTPVESSPVTIYSNRIGKKNAHDPKTLSRRPVKVNFPNLASRQAAWDARFSLKGSPYAVNEDLPRSIRILRAKQRQGPPPPPVPIPTLPTNTGKSSEPNLVSSPQPKPLFSPSRKTKPVTQKVHLFFSSTKKKGKKK